MADLNFVNLYVADAERSAAFYAMATGARPVQLSPGWALFVLDGGLKLGLWRRGEVQPLADGAPGSVELVLAEESDADVDERFTQWTGKGIVIAQPPTLMEFGYTFVALDPDGHRVRVYKLAA